MLHDVVEPAGGQDGVHPDHRLGHETDEVAGVTGRVILYMVWKDCSRRIWCYRSSIVGCVRLSKLVGRDFSAPRQAIACF